MTHHAELHREFDVIFILYWMLVIRKISMFYAQNLIRHSCAQVEKLIKESYKPDGHTDATRY